MGKHSFVIFPFQTLEELILLGLSIHCHVLIARAEQERVNIDQPLVKGDLSIDCNTLAACSFTGKMKYELERQVENLHKKIDTLC
jgi:hypothetical protein